MPCVHDGLTRCLLMVWLIEVLVKNGSVARWHVGTRGCTVHARLHMVLSKHFPKVTSN